jgi:hypothetical protein
VMPIRYISHVQDILQSSKNIFSVFTLKLLTSQPKLKRFDNNQK